MSEAHADERPEVWRESQDEQLAPTEGLRKVTNEPIYRPDILETISETINAMDGELRELSLDIHGM